MRPLFLVGYMGCGKSTFARKLGRRLGIGVVDTDRAVEEREGASVADIFRYEGEERFRQLEREVLEQVIARNEELIVATGGGLPVWSDNMERMTRARVSDNRRRTAGPCAGRRSP